jgi:hypothetical protein
MTEPNDDLVARLHDAVEATSSPRPAWEAIAVRGRRRQNQRRALAFAATFIAAAVLFTGIVVAAQRGPGTVDSAGVSAGPPVSGAGTPSTGAPGTATPGPATVHGPTTCAELEQLRNAPAVVTPGTVVPPGSNAAPATVPPIAQQPDPPGPDPINTANDDRPYPRTELKRYGSGWFQRRVVVGAGANARVLVDIPDDTPGSVANVQVVGDWVYYVAYDGDAAPSAIRKVALAGGTPQDVIVDPKATSFSVSPDQQRLVRTIESFTPPYEETIVVTDLLDGTERTIAGTRPDGLRFAAGLWDPDSRHLYGTLREPPDITDCRTGQKLSSFPGPDDPDAAGQILMVEKPTSVIRLDAIAGTPEDATQLAPNAVPAAVVTRDGRTLLVLEDGSSVPAPPATTMTVVDATTGETAPFVARLVDPTTPDVDFRLGDLAAYDVVPK